MVNSDWNGAMREGLVKLALARLTRAVRRGEFGKALDPYIRVASDRGADSIEINEAIEEGETSRVEVSFARD